MKSRIRTAFIALISLFAVMVGTATPAFAWYTPWDGKTYSYFVGESVNLNLGCGEQNMTAIAFSSGTIPEGLTIDSKGLVTGIPQTPGTHELSNYSCTFNNGANSSSNPYASVTIIINPAVTPQPSIIAHNLNTDACEFYLAYSFPSKPDLGSIDIGFSNQTGSILIIKNSEATALEQDTLYDSVAAISYLNELAQIGSGAVLVSEGAPFACGDVITASVSYQHATAPAATATAPSFKVDKPSIPTAVGGVPTQKLIALNNNECEFRVLATLPSAPQSGSTKITINSPSDGVDQLTFTISDEVAAGLMDFKFNPTDLSAETNTPVGIASLLNQVSSTWECGKTLYVSVEYRDSLGNYWSSTWGPELQTDGFAVTPTKPNSSTGSDFSVTAEQSRAGSCYFTVVVKSPDEARPFAIDIFESESNSIVASMVFRESISVNGTITANFSFTSKDDFYADVPVAEEDKILVGSPDCFGTYLVNLDSPGGILASTTFTLGETIPTCNSGSILDEENFRCLEVERGFYTTELNSVTPIACPTGMTTATTASKSINDCYKPIVQSIVGLKAPKALKFKGTTNLAIMTNSKAQAKHIVTGSCTAKITNVVTKVKGKKVTTKMLRVTAGTKAGTCTITMMAPAAGKYLALSKPVVIKVSKTGK